MQPQNRLIPTSTSHRPFSVLMSVYDREKVKFLDESLDSLTRSTVPVTELVLVEDGPLREELRAVIDRYRTQLSILSVRLPVNAGLPTALNAGLQECGNEYVARFDSDDLIVGHRFQIQLDYLDDHPEVCAVGSDVEEFDAASGLTTGRRTLPSEVAALRRFAKLRNPMNHPSVMFRKSVILAAGGYRSFGNFEDYALWVQCMVNGAEIANIAEPLVRMRSGIDQIRRRRGLGYMHREIELASEFRRIGFLSWTEAARFLALRMPMRLLPPSLLLNIYRRRLREPANP